MSGIFLLGDFRKVYCLLKTIQINALVAELLVKIGKFELAEAEYLLLIEHNPDNIDYLRGLAKAKQLDGYENSPEKSKELVKVYR